MGFGNFRYRVLVLICVALILWQSAKHWTPVFVSSDDHSQSSAAKLPVVQDLEVDGEVPKANKPGVQKVLVSVYYEALCPDSRNFVIKQLLPAFQRIGDNMQIELIPYGKAETHDTPTGYEFKCQHGPTECDANMIHACVVDLVVDPSVQLDYIACMIQNNVMPERAMNLCAAKVNLDVKQIDKCWKGTKGKELLAKFGEMTDDLSPKVTFIPTITLDKEPGNLLEILKNLLKQVCLRLNNPPPGCA